MIIPGFRLLISEHVILHLFFYLFFILDFLQTIRIPCFHFVGVRDLLLSSD
jgi:hypothetical protein